jgi:hypothetical protein
LLKTPACSCLFELQDIHSALEQGEGHRDLARTIDHSLLLMHPNQQGMFLDAATVLRGQPADLATAVWRAWHGPGASLWLQELRRYCLVDVDEEGCLQMLDVIAARARGILLESQWGGTGLHYGSRVWLQDGKLQGVTQVRMLGAALGVRVGATEHKEYIVRGRAACVASDQAACNVHEDACQI